MLCAFNDKSISEDILYPFFLWLLKEQGRLQNTNILYGSIVFVFFSKSFCKENILKIIL